MAESYDYIIVGAGSAGCVLANRLSADPGCRVLLVEAGKRDSYPWIKVPVGYLFTMMNPATDWCFKTAEEPGLGGRRLDYPRGKVLGGCSSINGMIYMRGQARDYDGWAQAGNRGWSWDEVLPYFKKSEYHHAGANEVHGAGGELRVEKQRLEWDILKDFRQAAIEAGIPPRDDFNDGNNEGVGFFEVNQRRGRRWSAADAFLKPAMGRANLRVLTEALCRRIVFEGRRAVGLEIERGGATEVYSARREVILAAGAVASPQILMLSGAGPGEELQRHGIEVLHALPGVGGNLQDHLQVRTAYRLSHGRTLNQLSHSLLAKTRMALEYALNRSGPLAMAPSQLGAFWRSDASYETPNIEYHVQPLTTEKLGDPLHEHPGVTASVCNLRPLSRGTVRLKTTEPGAEPDIRPNYLSDPIDRKVAADSLRLTRRIMAQPAVAHYHPVEFKPGPEIDGDEALAAAAGRIASTIFHPVGTCKMGSDPEAVVDDRLRVHGLERLRVVDASIMPTITSGNTHAPVVMIAEKASEMIQAEARA